jgi:hypothetical protein
MSVECRPRKSVERRHKMSLGVAIDFHIARVAATSEATNRLYRLAKIESYWKPFNDNLLSEIAA